MAFNLSNNKEMQSNRETNKIDIIEKTTRIVGNITSQADFRIDGKVEGTITTTGKVVIGEENTPDKSPSNKTKDNFGKISRNQQCPCGSGKKFKHCHGAL